MIVALAVAAMFQRKRHCQDKERSPERATEERRGVYHFLGWKLGDFVKSRPLSVRKMTRAEIRMSCE